MKNAKSLSKYNQYDEMKTQLNVLSLNKKIKLIVNAVDKNSDIVWTLCTNYEQNRKQISITVARDRKSHIEETEINQDGRLSGY